MQMFIADSPTIVMRLDSCIATCGLRSCGHFLAKVLELRDASPIEEIQRRMLIEAS